MRHFRAIAIFFMLLAPHSVQADDTLRRDVDNYFALAGTTHFTFKQGKHNATLVINSLDYLRVQGFADLQSVTPKNFKLKIDEANPGYISFGSTAVSAKTGVKGIRETSIDQLSLNGRFSNGDYFANSYDLIASNIRSIKPKYTFKMKSWLFSGYEQINTDHSSDIRLTNHVIDYRENFGQMGSSAKRIRFDVRLGGISPEIVQSSLRSLAPLQALLKSGAINPLASKFASAKSVNFHAEADSISTGLHLGGLGADHVSLDLQSPGFSADQTGYFTVKINGLWPLLDPLAYGLLTTFNQDITMTGTFTGIDLTTKLFSDRKEGAATGPETVVTDIVLEASNRFGRLDAKGWVNYPKGKTSPRALEFDFRATHFRRVVAEAEKRATPDTFLTLYIDNIKELENYARYDSDGTAYWKLRLIGNGLLDVNGHHMTVLTMRDG